MSGVGKDSGEARRGYTEGGDAALSRSEGDGGRFSSAGKEKGENIYSSEKVSDGAEKYSAGTYEVSKEGVSESTGNVYAFSETADLNPRENMYESSAVRKDSAQEMYTLSESESENENGVRNTHETADTDTGKEISAENTNDANESDKGSINDRMSYMVANPQEAAKAISTNGNTVGRIGRNNMRMPAEDGDEETRAKVERSNFLDNTRAKGLVQEEMIRSEMRSDFNVADKTQKSVHKDGSVTFTDVVAVAEKDTVFLGKEIKKGETVSIESKAGTEAYLTRDIRHISKQLEGMGEDSHRFLFTTADYFHMSDKQRARLNDVLAKNGAELNVLPYYSYDLTNALMHMDLRDYMATGESGDGSSEKMHTVETNSREEKFIFDIAKWKPEPLETKNAGLNEVSDSDREITKQILSDNRELHELDEVQREALINTAIETAVEKHRPDMTEEEINEIRGKISFTDAKGIAEDYNNTISVERARYIQGYCNSHDGTIKINTEAYGSDTREALVTIEHEVIHLIAKNHTLTGLKRADIPGGNVGMNEGITEMYASDDMEEFVPDREESSYIEEVGLMRRYNDIIGADVLHEAYFSGDNKTLAEDFDDCMGENQYDHFCVKLDSLLISEESGDFKTADMLHEELDQMLDEYEERKRNKS